jgi:hypothetical protein
MRISNSVKCLAVAAVLGATASTPAPAGAAVREYEGTVVSVDSGSRTFRLRDSERGTVRVRVTRATRFERIPGFSGLEAGLRNVEAVVRRSNGRWVAVSVEISGGGGNHGGGSSDDD